MCFVVSVEFAGEFGGLIIVVVGLSDAYPDDNLVACVVV